MPRTDAGTAKCGISSGINDFYTATAVLAQLSASLSRLMAKALPSGLVRDKLGKARIVYPVSTYRALIGIAFGQIRQNGADKPIVVIHMLEALGRRADHAHLPTQVAVSGPAIFTGETALAATPWKSQMLTRLTVGAAQS